MSCDPDCADLTVLEGGDDYPVGTLSSEPLCAITDDMIYQEKIEALSGTIYDYDDVIDNHPDYCDYNDPCDYEEWGAWDDSGESGTCGDTCRSDTTDGGTVFSRGWSGDWSDGAVVAPESTVIKDTDRSPSEPISGHVRPDAGQFRSCRPVAFGDARPHK